MADSILLDCNPSPQIDTAETLSIGEQAAHDCAPFLFHVFRAFVARHAAARAFSPMAGKFCRAIATNFAGARSSSVTSSGA
jgi:hypothetical protein